MSESSHYLIWKNYMAPSFTCIPPLISSFIFWWENLSVTNFMPLRVSSANRYERSRFNDPERKGVRPPETWNLKNLNLLLVLSSMITWCDESSTRSRIRQNALVSIFFCTVNFFTNQVSIFNPSFNVLWPCDSKIARH